jgi:hypothetical protein
VASSTSSAVINGIARTLTAPDTVTTTSSIVAISDTVSLARAPLRRKSAQLWPIRYIRASIPGPDRQDVAICDI